MNKGFLKAILYYTVGLGLAGISYLTVGHEYIHAPGLHHIIILLTFFGGFLWLTVSTIQFFIGQRTENLKGTIFTNLLMSLGFILYITNIIINEKADKAEFEKQLDKIRIEESGDTTTMYHGGNIVYMKVKDSVLINFIDSTKIKWDEIELVKK
jgi:hypothetical protein